MPECTTAIGAAPDVSEGLGGNVFVSSRAAFRAEPVGLTVFLRRHFVLPSFRNLAGGFVIRLLNQDIKPIQSRFVCHNRHFRRNGVAPEPIDKKVCRFLIQGGNGPAATRQWGRLLVKF